jgi:hypothetical protein
MIDTLRARTWASDEYRQHILAKCVKAPFFTKSGEMKFKYITKVRVLPFYADFTLWMYEDDKIYTQTDEKGFIIVHEDKDPHWVYFEGSLPKIWYGENVHLLHINQIYPSLELLEKTFVQYFGIFPPFAAWELQRIDVVYAYKLASEEQTKEVIAWFETLEYPRKRKYVYPGESVVWRGGWSSVKIYRKDVEYEKKDYKFLINNGFQAQAETIKELAKNVIRFEITLRKKALKDYFQKKDQLAYDKTLEAEEHPKTIKLASITPQRLLDTDFYFDMLTKNRDNLEPMLNKQEVKDEALLKQLLTTFKATKAVRLFCFYKTYFCTNPIVKKLIKKYASSSELSENKSSIKQAQIQIPDVLNTAPFDFIFPSPLVVNAEPEPTAVAEGLHKRLKCLSDYVEQVKEDRPEGRSILDAHGGQDDVVW